MSETSTVKKFGWKNTENGAIYENEAGTLEFSINDFASSQLEDLLKEENIVCKQAMIYGVKVKLERSIARKKDEALNDQEKLDVMRKMLDNLIDGEWTQKREKVDQKRKVYNEMLEKANNLDEDKKKEALDLLKVMFPEY